MESIPLKKDAVLAVFGTRAGTKLLNFLNDCCQPTITLSCVASCAGLDSSGNPTYNLVASVTYSTSISGYTSLIGYVSNEPFPNWGNVTNVSLNNLGLNEATIFVNNIVAGVPCVMANLSGVDGIAPGTYYAMVTDNRGNYATPISFSFPACD